MPEKQKQTKKKNEMKGKQEKEEPKIVIKPLGRFGGLDFIHIALIIVVALLLALLLVVSYSKVVIKVNNTSTEFLPKPLHNSTQVLEAVEKLLGSYNFVNSSLSLLPYVSQVQNASVAFVPQQKVWIVEIPAKNPYTNTTFRLGFLVNDTNISDILPLEEIPIPSRLYNYTVVHQGVIKIGGMYPCLNQSPLEIDWFIDPYAPGAIQSLKQAVALESKYGSKVSVGIKIYNMQYTLAIAKEYGIGNAEMLGKYIFCASQQKNFSLFINNLNNVYTGQYVPQQELNNLANESRLDFAQLQECVANAQPVINNQILLAQYYNIMQTPIAIVNCEYMAIPQTAQQAVCFANSTICR